MAQGSVVLYLATAVLLYGAYRNSLQCPQEGYGGTELIQERILKLPIHVGFPEQATDYDFWSLGNRRLIDKEVIFRILESQFTSTPCRDASYTRLVNIWQSGLGSRLHTMGIPFLKAILAGDMYVEFGFSSSTHIACKEFIDIPNNEQCLWGPLSSCSVIEKRPEDWLNLIAEQFPNPQKYVVDWAPVGAKLDLRFGNGPRDVISNLPIASPNTLEGRVVHVLAGFMLRPHPTILAYAQRVRDSLKLPPDCITMHFRRGDKILVGEGPYTSIREVMRKLETVTDMKRRRHLYIMSDTAEISAHMKYFPEHKTYFIHDANAVSAKGHNMYDAYYTPGQYDRMRGALVDILLGSMCQIYVGPMSSNISRLIKELRETLIGYHAVSLSSDVPYGGWH